MNKRLFIQSHAKHEVESIETVLNRNLNINISGTEFYTVYEIMNVDQSSLDLFVDGVLKDELIQTLSDHVDMTENYLSYEAVDGQYDQITDWSTVLLNNKDAQVQVSYLVLFNQDLDLEAARRLLVNPLEFQDKDIDVFSTPKIGIKKALKTYDNFITLNKEEIEAFYNKQGFAMEIEDLEFIQDYFKNEDRNPTETELLVLDTYWSDHCRHTTFMTSIEDIEFEDFPLKEAVENSFKEYLADKEELGRADKVVSLMDITAQNGRYAKAILNDSVIEVSDEVNACSIRINVDVDGVDEPWLLMFKNETHNHPTEIEPFGGASTCIGGAIRDPLSGRAYVYQAMRITGSGNVLETLDETHPDKLPQAFISKQAAAGYSHYADQIGISSSYVKEIYHDSYKAKRMELGAVVGAIKESDLIRQKPLAGDLIVMMGGRTGRDGVGGATGSSDVQSLETAETNAAEVQKGNALEERKIMRLFRDPEISSMIKKSNDFGAGGVSVAIGELADGLEIDLDQVKLKYDDLNATEIAISESQERMAVVLDPKNVDRFLELAKNENVVAVVVAVVNDSNRLVVKDAQGTYVNLDRDFLDSGGVRQKTNAIISGSDEINPLVNGYDINKENILSDVSHITNASQAGLAQLFNAHGALIKPLLGKMQLTPNIGSVEKIPLLKGNTNTVSMLTHGFIPSVSEYSPYLGGVLAVVESLSKTVAMGGDFRKVYFSFQEYFNRLTNPQKWGRVMQALLGTYSAQKALGLCAIGGKDSMSGTYGDLDVVDTLVSFACSPQRADYLVSSELKSESSNLYIVDLPMNDLGVVNYQALVENYDAYYELVKEGHVLSAMTSDDASVVVALSKMALGNQIGFNVILEDQDTAVRPGSIIFESKEDLDGFRKLGNTNADNTLVINDVEIKIEDMTQAHITTLEKIYPISGFDTNSPEKVSPKVNDIKVKQNVKVLVPIFPGTVGEYDLVHKFQNLGAQVNSFVYQGDNEAFVSAIEASDVIAFADGSINGDVPQISGFALQVLNQEVVKTAIEKHLEHNKRILGFGNGFQLLVKSGLIPYEKVQESKLSFAKNNTGRPINLEVNVQESKHDSFWLNNIETRTLYHAQTYGQLVGDVKDLKVAFYYDGRNPNGSKNAIEGLISNKGNVFGRMTSVSEDILKNAMSDITHE